MNIRFPAKMSFALRPFRFLCAGLVAVLVVSCGGGSDDDTPRYQSVATTGELIDYQVDTANLTYSYTITESQFGLAGVKSTGTLKKNADGSYTPSGAPEGRVVVLSNGLLFGAVRERFGANLFTAAIIGIKDPVPTVAALAADYNFVQSSCVAALCTSTRGTLRIETGGTWSYCRDANLAAGGCSAAGTANSGTLEARGAAQWRLKSRDGTDVGTAMGFNSAGQNMVVVDLKDKRTDGFGVGMLIGSQLAVMVPPQTESAWIAATGSGHWLEFNASGTNIYITQFDSQPVSLATSFVANDPWTGMVTTAWGEIGFMANAGIYMLTMPSGDVELGVRLR
jgi:hypothetical protein